MGKRQELYNHVFNFVDFGIDVQNYLEATNVTQGQLGVWCGVSGSTISNIVTGSRGTSYTMDTYVRICNTCMLEPSDYFTLHGEPYAIIGDTRNE